MRGTGSRATHDRFAGVWLPPWPRIGLNFSRECRCPSLSSSSTVLGNLKTSLRGTYHAFRFSKYAARYLGAFACRFNRRFDLATLPQLLLDAAVRCRTRTEPALRRAELRANPLNLLGTEREK